MLLEFPIGFKLYWWDTSLIFLEASKHSKSIMAVKQNQFYALEVSLGAEGTAAQYSGSNYRRDKLAWI